VPLAAYDAAFDNSFLRERALSTSEPTAARRVGLDIVVDIIVAPNAAFARIREVPAWGWAFVAASLLGIVGMLLAQSAYLHALQVSGPALYGSNPAVTQLPPEKQAEMMSRMIAFGATMVRLQFLFVPIGLLIGALLSAVIMLIANAISHGDGTFKRFFALSMTTAVVSSLGLFLNGVIAVVRGPGGYETMQSVQTALPSLALLAPGAGAKLATFLSALNVTSIWATVLSALGMTAVARIKPPVAWVTALLVLAGGAALAALFVK
jgi:hypothetical protein